MAECSIPENKNFLSPLDFRLVIQRLPHVNYFCTNASIPEISMGQVDNITNPFIKMPVPGEKLTFGQLNLRFRIDEDMKNFQEIYNWMIGLGFPDNFNQRAALDRSTTNTGLIYSDASLIVVTNQYKPNIDVKFIDMYPVSLSSVDFNVEQTSIEYLSADVTFAYRKYQLTPIAQ